MLMEGKAIDNQLVILLHVETDMPQVTKCWVYGAPCMEWCSTRDQSTVVVSVHLEFGENSVLYKYHPTFAVLHVTGHKFGA